eukprot:CAMPEP_0185689756 /NCGR_PEP_ID=MMETSP1164-20130828/666_1 /TAXON_ID=1104430 /ORGANISM="Chrysoreinhardia sp, Strain CCMP2950" /LENGTH=180 /DNA_ID=CAMNT_0028356267 /DNA_START=225 /DNA_END=765 /DNA_ORIENTATION=+
MPERVVARVFSKVAAPARGRAPAVAPEGRRRKDNDVERAEVRPRDRDEVRRERGCHGFVDAVARRPPARRRVVGPGRCTRACGTPHVKLGVWVVVVVPEARDDCADPEGRDESEVSRPEAHDRLRDPDEAARIAPDQVDEGGEEIEGRREADERRAARAPRDVRRAEQRGDPRARRNETH